jgi:hypothetical protein
MLLIAYVGCAVAALVALVFAGAVQTAVGRTDLRRGHRALSLTLWGTVLLALATLGAFVHWVVDVSIMDLDQAEASVVAPQGGWLEVSGKARHRGEYYPTFLFDSSSERKIRLPSQSTRVSFSGDGRHAAWFEAAERSGGWRLAQLVVADLAADHPRPRRTNLIMEAPHWFGFALSPDGHRAAMIDRSANAVSLFELPEGRSLGSVRATLPWGVSIAFVSPDRVRLHVLDQQSKDPETYALRILETSTESPHFEEIGRIERITSSFFPRFFAPSDPADTRLLMRPQSETYETSVVLVDRTSGATLATIVPWGHQNTDAGFLSDGRVAVAAATNGRATVRRLDSFGREELSIDLGAGAAIHLGGEPAPGHLLVSVAPDGPWWNVTGSTLYDVDLAHGGARTVRTNATLRPVLEDLLGRTAGPAPVGSLRTRLVLTAESQLGIYDPTTGTVKPFLQLNQDLARRGAL